MDIYSETSGAEVSLTEAKDSFKHRQCNHCGGRRFTTCDRFHPFMIHWVLNPGLAMNELLIGQRVARQIHFCKQCGGWFQQQGQFVECSSCKGFHNAKIWDGCRFGNWLGLVCPDCGEMIPCLLNLTSAVVLILLFRQVTSKHGSRKRCIGLVKSDDSLGPDSPSRLNSYRQALGCVC